MSLDTSYHHLKEKLLGAKRRLSYYLASYYRLVFSLKDSPPPPEVLGTRIPQAVLERLNYYLKLRSTYSLSNPHNRSVLLNEKKNVYFFDLFEFVRHFDPRLKFNYVFGDVTEVPQEPSLVKSRPIGSENDNAVLFKLEKMRHFYFVDDPLDFRDKLPKLAWRGRLHLNVKKETRLSLLEGYYSNPLCNVGHVNSGDLYPQLRRESMSITEQLRYKYLLSLEGVDVATNLKWIMSSNSLCFAQRPRFETWFMEGTLIPGFHYVEVADDFSDLEAKINHYEAHPHEAEEIIRNANAYVEQFKDPVTEDFLCMLVLDKYLRLCSNNEAVIANT